MEFQHCMAKASQPFSTSQSLTANISFACFSTLSPDMWAGMEPYSRILSMYSAMRAVSSMRLAAAMSSERSATQVVTPLLCSIFSENLTVLNGSGRIPMSPMRA